MEQEERPPRQDVPLISGMLFKRAQGRSTFGRTNWKRRWFVLHPGELSYWTLEGGRHNPAAECKGTIPLKNVYALERVALEAFGKPHMIQIVHTSVLYVQCPSREDCDDWLLALRQECATNSILHAKYHPGFFDGNKWSCCNIASKDFKGCQKSFDYSTLFAEGDGSPASMPTTQPALSLTQKNTRDKRESAASVQYRGAKHSAGSIASIPTKDRKGSTFSSKTETRSAKSSRDFSYVPSVKPINRTTSPLRSSFNPPASQSPNQQPIVVRVTRVAYV